MDLSAANTGLWNGVLQFGLLSAAMLAAYLLYKHIKLIRKSMMPVAVCAGFMLLAARYLGLKLDDGLLEGVVYHALAFGFIASALRTNAGGKGAQGGRTGIKSGAVIVSTYLVQGILGLIISLALSYTVMPGLFRASGILLPMGYGQGPGQANNIGTVFESLGFEGGRSFGLSIAAMGYLVACVIGVIMLNVLRRKNMIRLPEGGQSNKRTVVEDEAKNSVPVSLDALSLQVGIVALIYFATYWVSLGLTSAITAIAPSAEGTVSQLIWGFNFIIGSALGLLFRFVTGRVRRDANGDERERANESLNRISGICFDYMIIAGIASIKLEDIRSLWVPFLLMTVLGGAVTWLYLKKICKRVYPDYYSQGLIAMFGMLTGTISSGVLLLREIDPELSTPAANQLLVGSGFAIILGAPMLVLISVAPKSDLMTWLSLGIMVVYLSLLLLLIYAKKRKTA